MTKTNSKKALLSSAFALVLSVAMLIGTTFAWFTDTASTAVNKIQAGNLDVALEMLDTAQNKWVTAEGKTLNFVKAGNVDEEVLWEPGCRYELPALRVVNKGNLALKYKIQITGIQGDAKLNDVIDWTINDDPINLTEGHLAANAEGDSFTIKGVMKTTAGNEYQGLSIDGIGITVYATQDTVESDSFDNQYDKNAEYRRAVFNGGSGTVDYNIYAQGYDGAIYAENGAQVTVNADVTAKEDNKYAMAVWANGAGTVVNITGGYFTQEITGTDNQYDMIYASGGAKINISGGTFKLMGGDYKWTLNCKDNSGSVITVTGGTFYKFDPSAERAGQDNEVVVPDGYSVYQSGDWYTVVKGTGVVPGTQDEMNTGITGSGNKDVTVVMPANSSFTLDNGIANEGNKSRNVTFVGDGSQTVDVITNAISAEGGQLNYQRGSSFTFENLTIQAGEGSFDGIVCDELTYKDCTIKGKLTLYGKATFINCTFENDMANQYSIWTWGGTDVTFEGCTFNTNGKAILLYGQATESKPTNLVVNNCTFNDRNNGTAGKAAIEIGNDYNATYTLTVKNATVNGFADGKNTGSKLWANKNSMDAAHLTVTIDGSKVQ